MNIEELCTHFSDAVIAIVVADTDATNRADNQIVGILKNTRLSLCVVKDWFFDGMLHITVKMD